MKRWLKYFLFLVFGVLFLIAGLILFTQTPVFKNWLRNRIVAEASKVLNGDLEIGRISGNLVRNIEASEILLRSQGDTVLYLPKLAIELTPTRLLRKEVLVNSVLIEAPYLKLRQLADTTWNVASLFREEVAAKSDTIEPDEPPGWRFTFEDLHLNNGRLEFTALDTLSPLPERVESIHSRMAISYGAAEQMIHLKEFGLVIPKPGLVLEELSFLLRVQPKRFFLQDLVIQTAQNRIEAAASFDSAAGPLAELNLSTAPLDFDEVRLFLPGLRIKGSPRLSLETDIGRDSLDFGLFLSQLDQHLRLKGSLSNLKRRPRYRISGGVEKLNLADWLIDPPIPSKINASISIEGNGIEAQNAQLEFKTEFEESMLLQLPLERLQLEGNYAEGNLTADLDLLADFGRLLMEGSVEDPVNARDVELRGEVKHLNAAELFRNEGLKSDINLTLKAEATGLTPGQLDGSFKLDLAPSTLLGVALDTLFATVRLRQASFLIDTLHARSRPLQFNLAGELALDSLSDLRFDGQLNHLTVLQPFLQVDTVDANGSFFGRVSGKRDSLVAEASYALSNLVFEAFRADFISGELTVFEQADSLRGSATAQIKKLGTSEFQLNSIDLQTEFTEQTAHLFADIAQNDSLDGQFEALITADSLQTKVIIRSIALNLANRLWSGGGESMQLVLGQGSYEVRDFRLASGDRLIEARGAVGSDGMQNFKFRADGIDLGALVAAVGTQMKANGLLSMAFDIRGTAENPSISANLAASEGRLGSLAFQECRANFDYQNERLAWEFVWNFDQERALSGDGYLSVNLAFTKDGGFLYDQKPVRFGLHTDGIPLSDVDISSGDLTDGLGGELVCDLSVEGTLKDPRFGGSIRVRDGSVNVPAYGVQYDDVQMTLTLDSTQVSLENLEVRSQKGVLSASGQARFDSSLAKAKLQSLDLALATNDFLLASSQDYEILLGGNVELAGNLEEPRIAGQITVNRSRFFLPALVKDYSKAGVEDELPLLVAATTQEDSSTAVSMSESEKDLPGLEFYKNLLGTVKLEIHRNTWLRSTDMNVEISGSLDLVKNGPEFEIFGTIQTVRGNYDLFGKRFEITGGNITFQGGTEYDPRITITAEHDFRTYDKEKKTLKLEITGTSLEPKILFLLDDQEITEGDAISYVFFGRGIEELTYGQKSEMAGEAGETDLARDLAASAISAKISQALGKQLNVDMLEIKAKQSWQEASFVVGKYITDDVFVSYQQQFGDRQSNEVAPYLITLEYEVTPFLFLQLINGDDKESGYDIILKFER